jgi:hypothetical protein
VTEATETQPVEITGEAASPVPVADTVSRERYDQTLTEVRDFIDHLNAVIRNKNYNSWRNFLSSDYFARISSPEYLARQSDMPALKTQGIVLRSPNDFFTNVVVPSRAESQVDEIDFGDDNVVRAYFIDARQRRLRLYELQKIGNEWKIVD